MAVTDEAIEKIKDMIVGGEFRPGDRLAKEPELARRLGFRAIRCARPCAP